MNPVFVELLAADLNEKFYIKIFSETKNKLLRLIDMIINYYRHYLDSQLIIIDLYSTNAYYYGLLLSLLCSIHNKTYFVILSGGDLKNRYRKSKSFQYILKKSTKEFENLVYSICCHRKIKQILFLWLRILKQK